METPLQGDTCLLQHWCPMPNIKEQQQVIRRYSEPVFGPEFIPTPCMLCVWMSFSLCLYHSTNVYLMEKKARSIAVSKILKEWSCVATIHINTINSIVSVHSNVEMIFIPIWVFSLCFSYHLSKSLEVCFNLFLFFSLQENIYFPLKHLQPLVVLTVVSGTWT